MAKTTKSMAEAQFAATQKKGAQQMDEKQKASLEKSEHMAKLRALRLAKEAAERDAAGKAGGAQLPRVHRRES